MRPISLAFLLCLLHCRRETTDQEHRLSRWLDGVDRQASEVDATEAAAWHLTAEWEAVERRFEDASLRYQIAQTALERAARTYGQASSEYSQVSAEAQESAKLWHLYRQLVLVAAAVDAAKLQQGRVTSEVADCSGGMSTARYRDLLISQGVSLVGLDVDHIVPRSLGGADHPDNYQLLLSSLNRSIGNDWGEGKCAAVGDGRCARAIRASNECGSLRGAGF